MCARGCVAMTEKVGSSDFEGGGGDAAFGYALIIFTVISPVSVIPARGPMGSGGCADRTSAFL